MPRSNKPRRAADEAPVALQLSAEPMRTWVDDGKGGRFRPVMAVVVARGSGLCLGVDVGEREVPPSALAGRLLARALQAAGLPRDVRVRVQVRDPELASLLSRRVELAAAQFEVVSRLDAVDAMMAEMERELYPQSIENPLDQPGMSVERLASFAHGAVAFYAARPWRHLHDDDVIEVQAPAAPVGMRFASLLGAGGQVFGFGFYRDAKGYDRLASAADPSAAARGPRWSLMFHEPQEVPPEDAELWEKHGLPVAPDDSIPLLLRYHGKARADRPDGATLTFTEGLCRAVAATTEAELDSGRWEKTVRTFDGDVTYRLAIPHLLQPQSAPRDSLKSVRALLERSMRQIGSMIEQSGARTAKEANALLNAHSTGEVPAPDAASDPRERARDLCDESQGQRSRRELQMLRDALKLDPDCADAYVLLARRESDPREAERLYRLAVEAGRRALGEEPFQAPDYPFWGALESRPYMRALDGLADALDRQDRLPEAAEVLARMLRLNPGDNQGVRYRYVPLQILLGRLDEAMALIDSEAYRDDASALFDFAGALVAFQQGRPDDAASRLQRAAGRNPYAIPMILRPDLAPPQSPNTWTAGDPSEAMMIADLLGDVWAADPKAMKWLHEWWAARAGPRTKPGRKRKS